MRQAVPRIIGRNKWKLIKFLFYFCNITDPNSPSADDALSNTGEAGKCPHLFKSSRHYVVAFI